MANTEERARAIISKVLHVEVVDVDITLDKLGADSLDIVELSVDLEDEFRITGLGDDWTEETTVGQVLADVEKLAGKS